MKLILTTAFMLICSNIFSMEEAVPESYKRNIDPSQHAVNTIAGWGNECLIRAFFSSIRPNSGY